MSSLCPPTYHGSKKRSPNISTVTLDSVDTDKERLLKSRDAGISRRLDQQSF